MHNHTTAGCPPEATNFWMGGERSITSWHADHYENMYAVISGSKRFFLLPPADAWRMRMRRGRVTRWALAADGAWRLEAPPDDGHASTVWSAVPLPRHDDDCCLLDDGAPQPLTVTVLPGETLYLPAGWWHAVRQGPRTIAVNFWHDQHWGAGEAFAGAIRKLAEQAGLCQA